MTAFNCQPVRFEAELSDSLRKDFPEGLNSQHDFHFVFVDIDMIDEDSLATMRKLQPKAKFVFMCNSIDLAKAMKRFSLTVRKALIGSDGANGDRERAFWLVLSKSRRCTMLSYPLVMVILRIVQGCKDVPGTLRTRSTRSWPW